MESEKTGDAQGIPRFFWAYACLEEDVNTTLHGAVGIQLLGDVAEG